MYGKTVQGIHPTHSSENLYLVHQWSLVAWVPCRFILRWWVTRLWSKDWSREPEEPCLSCCCLGKWFEVVQPGSPITLFHPAQVWKVSFGLILKGRQHQWNELWREIASFDNTCVQCWSGGCMMKLCCDLSCVCNFMDSVPTLDGFICTCSWYPWI